ncbi:hypothetical protein GGF43_000461 [Coemansia sp. RSA 2618]|nr:hypothetical protein GGF43_000461 [Coemansia sp. RSA 2618]
MDANVARAERTLSLLTTTFLANSESVKANISLVLDTVLSQNLFVYIDVAGVSAETAKRYTSAVQKWLARINSLVTCKTSDARMAGVLLVKHTALQSAQLLAENAAKWTTSLLGVLGKVEVTPVLVATLQTLLAFIDAVRDIPMLYREIVSAQVPRMNQAVLAMVDKNPDLTSQALELLDLSATWFPTLFRPSIDKTETLCLRFLDGSSMRSSPELCDQAARCLAALSLAGGKVAAEERWFQCAQQAMGTIQQCIGHIMCTGAGDEPRQFALPPMADDFIVSIPQAADRISAMTEVLIALLTQPTTVDIPVPVDGMLGTASRLAMVPVRVANSKTVRAEYDLVPLLTPQIQRASIRIMAALAISLGSHMQPHLSAVARAITAISTRQIASPAIHVALHCLLQLYIERYGYGFVVHLPYDLVVSVVGDICVHQKSKAIEASAAAPAPVSSKKRGGNGKSRASNAFGASEPIQATHIHWDDAVLAALTTVLALLQHTPTVLTSALRTRIDSQVLTLLMLFAIGGMETPFATRQSDAPHRALLYRCLEASILSPDPWQKAILPHAVSAFNAGLADPATVVRDVCAEALITIDPIVHSRLPAQLREPDTDENVAEEKQVAQMMSSYDGSTSIGAVLSGVQDDIQSDDEGDEAMQVTEDVVVDDVKRFKQDIPIVPVVQSSSILHAPGTYAASDSQQQSQPPPSMQPAAAPAPSNIQTKNSAAPPAKLSSTLLSSTPAKVSTVEVSDEDDDDDIPDIVMEGSDSEDE